MRLVTKEFYTLAELQAAWDMPDQDMHYLIATSRLKLSIVVYSQTLVTLPSGPHLPTDAKRQVYSGMLDLNPSDAITILRQGEATIACFSMPDGQAGHFPYFFREQTVTKVDELMVRHTERERVERQWLASRASDGPMPLPALASTITSWPQATSSRTPSGVSPTRYSWFLISLTVPMRMATSSDWPMRMV